MNTERLEIKKTSINDVDLLLKMDKQVDTQKYLGGIKDKSRKERIEFLKKKDSFTVFLDHTPIGFIELSSDGELSYIFDSDYWNQGYCTEVCHEIIQNSDFDKIYAETVVDNISSIRVLEKLGFKRIKEFKKDSINFYYYEKEL